jgi:hypothetical protein
MVYYWVYHTTNVSNVSHMFAIFAFINGYALFIKYGVLENPPFSSIIFNYGGFFFAACVCVCSLSLEPASAVQP